VASSSIVILDSSASVHIKTRARSILQPACTATMPTALLTRAVRRNGARLLVGSVSSTPTSLRGRSSLLRRERKVVSDLDHVCIFAAVRDVHGVADAANREFGAPRDHGIQGLDLLVKRQSALRG
jgi:hypothetical protein